MQHSSETTVEEISTDVFRISTWIPGITADGLTFNQFLLTGEEPFLFHTGHRQLFAQVSRAITQVIPLTRLRWISFGHIEADECGAMNMLLAAAPHAEVIHSALAVQLSLTDVCDRTPVSVEESDVLDTGGHRLRFIQTPHVPHNWESALWFDESTSTMLAGDLFTHVGRCTDITESDIVEKALDAERLFGATAMTNSLGTTLRRLAQFRPVTLALMHGASYRGDGAGQLRSLADGFADAAQPQQ